MTNQTKVCCPECGQEIDINDVITHQFEEKYKEKFDLQVAEERKKLDEKVNSLARDKADFEDKKKIGRAHV